MKLRLLVGYLPRHISELSGVIALGIALLFSGCATPVKVDSSPQGASVIVGGKQIGTTPTQWQVENSGKPVEVSFSLPGYFPEQVSYGAGNKPTSVFVTLEPAKLAKSFEIRSEPARATVRLDGRQAGTTPMTLPVEFVRDNKDAPWTPQQLTLSFPDHEAETLTLRSTSLDLPTVSLARLKDERVFSITAGNVEGDALNASVMLNGKPAGMTPLSLPITFQRSDKTKPWPRFSASVEIPGKYKPKTIELGYVGETRIPLNLDPVTEITTVIHSPEVIMTPTGAALKFSETKSLAMLRTRDDSKLITDLKPVTKFDRQDMRPANRSESISGFTVTPDGQNVIFALSEIDESGNRYSNLFIKRSDDALGGLSRLTSGVRYMDFQPFVNKDGGNYLVFVSNRGERAKADLFRSNLVENRLAGGISRLTTDSRFNYNPTYGDSNRQLFYLSVEQAFPKAEIQISSIRFDGSLPTQLPVVGEQVNNTHAERIFFVKVDPDTNKKQIYSATVDGRLETALVNREDLKRSNCFLPSVSSDGQRVLFVSDFSVETLKRLNHDIYLIDADGTNLRRLTYNESEDTLPVWSPTEEGVVYFLSTRGGATNIWRFKVVGTR